MQYRQKCFWETLRCICQNFISIQELDGEVHSTPLPWVKVWVKNTLGGRGLITKIGNRNLNNVYYDDISECQKDETRIDSKNRLKMLLPSTNWQFQSLDSLFANVVLPDPFARVKMRKNVRKSNQNRQVR